MEREEPLAKVTGLALLQRDDARPTRSHCLRPADCPPIKAWGIMHACNPQQAVSCCWPGHYLSLDMRAASREGREWLHRAILQAIL